MIDSNYIRFLKIISIHSKNPMIYQIASTPMFSQNSDGRSLIRAIVFYKHRGVARPYLGVDRKNYTLIEAIGYMNSH